jgi:hypothetical protein
MRLNLSCNLNRFPEKRFATSLGRQAFCPVPTRATVYTCCQGSSLRQSGLTPAETETGISWSRRRTGFRR